ncbi:hypothetical protein FCM35_KLT18956 [Carex littledalei]|uniref:Uncharacterized protein n=1 Tax=Carex littledalei TaxID=544730 RepID=A0A833R0N4_9POAL|nr:hypothetical protein FCM35_KLT18956 [Carex littledalei]
MASIGRSASAINALRSVALCSRSAAAALPKPSVPLRSFPFVRRSVVSALGSVESLMPLHSAIASARLRSIIASDSSYWSCLSQDLFDFIFTGFESGWVLAFNFRNISGLILGRFAHRIG